MGISLNKGNISKEKELLKKMAEWDFSDDDISGQDLESKVYQNIKSYFEQMQERFEKALSVSGQMKGITDVISNVSDHVRQTTQFIAQGLAGKADEAEDCKRAADTIAVQIENMSSQYQHMMAQTEMQINQMVEMSENINSVTSMLYSIAKQTNLLAVQASVEAARAGEAGRSFRVIADEICKLSVESTETSYHMNQSVNELSDELHRLKQSIDQSQSAFSAQDDTVSEVADVFGEIDRFTVESIKEQKSLIKDLTSLTAAQSDAVHTMDELSEDLNTHMQKIKKEFARITIVRDIKKKRKIALMFDCEIQFYKITEKEAIKTAKMLDFDIEIFAPKSRDTSIEEMSRFLEYVMREEFDGIIISPIFDKIIEELLKKAASKGIKIVFLNLALPDVPYESLITSDGMNLGVKAAKITEKILKGKGTVLAGILSDVHNLAIKHREEGFIKELQGSGIEVKKISIPCSPSAQEAEQIISNMLTENPNAELIYATNADWGLLFGEYFSKYKIDKIVITIDFVKEMISYIKNGYIHYAVAQRNFVWGSLALKGLADVFDGKTMNKYNDTGAFEVSKNENIEMPFSNDKDAEEEDNEIIL